MPHNFRKLIAILLAVWIPLFGGNALAASVSSVSMQHGSCHEMMQGGQHGAADASHQDSSCGSACHLACCGYLTVEQFAASPLPQIGNVSTPYLFSFHSITSTPLLPPPLA